MGEIAVVSITTMTHALNVSAVTRTSKHLLQVIKMMVVANVLESANDQNSRAMVTVMVKT